MRWIVVAVSLVGTAGCAGNRVADGPPIQVHRTKFTYNSPAKQPIYDWFALDPAFVGVLEQHPPALTEARKATPYRTASWIGGIASVAFIIKSVVSAIDESNAGNFNNDVWSTDYTIAVGFGVAAGVFDAFARRYINRSVSLFNANATGGNRTGAEGIPSSGGSLHLEVSPVYRPGAGAGLVGRIPIR